MTGCEYQCDSSFGTSCSPDPDTPFLTSFEPTGDVCSEPDHDCDEVEPGVYDCRPPPAEDDQDCQDSVGNPCDPLTGNKRYAVTDYAAPGLEFSRTYNSAQERVLQAHLGRGWSHNYAGYITEWDDGLRLITGSGRFHPFIETGGGRYLSTLSGQLVIDETATEWVLKRPGRHEVYDRATGLLSAVRYPDQPEQDVTLSRDGTDRITEITNVRGRALLLHYDDGLLIGLTTPDGPIVFDYDDTGHGASELVAVIYPDNESEQYQYETRATRSLLTEVLAPGGGVKGVYTYDSRGRVTDSRPAPGIDGHTLQYRGSGRTVVTTPLGEEIEYQAISAQGWFGAATASRSGTVSETIDYADLTFFRPSEIDREGQITEYDYDAVHREIARREGAGTADERTITTTWNDTHFRKASETFGDGQVVYQYDSAGRRTQETRHDLTTSSTRIWTQDYCPAVNPAQGCPLAGLLRQITAPGNAVTEYSYYLTDAGNGHYRAGDLHTLTNPAGHITEFLAYDGAGRPLHIRDANGVDTHMTYHARGWLLSRSVDGAVTSYTYLPNGLVSRITQPDGSTLDFEYDSARRLTAIENALGERIEYDLDAAGNRTAERIRDDSGTLRFELQQAYDQLGRLQATLTGTGHETEYAYDAVGNLVEITDPLNHVTEHSYDPLNRLIQTLDAAGGETGFAYDARDNLVQVTDPEGLSTHYTYNGFDELIALDSPDTGITTYSYDNAGNRISQTDARGVTTTYSYDVLNRLTGIQYPDSSLDVTYVYDEPDTQTSCSGSHPVGRLTRMIDPSGTTTYCYDARGNVTDKARVVGLFPVTVSYAYDSADRLTAITYPSGQQVLYDHDVTGRVTEVTVVDAGSKKEVLIDDIEHLPFGPVAQYTFGNRQMLQRVHDLDYRITDVTSPALQLHFRRDPVGNIDRLGDAPGAATPLEEYVYGDLYRLEAVQDSLGIDVEAYTYDLIGNRLDKTTGAGTEPYDYPLDSHRLTGVAGQARTFDAAGNIIADANGNRQYTYGDNSRLIGFTVPTTSATYIHNGRGERTSKVVNGGGPGDEVHFIYDEAGRLLAELTYPPIGFFLPVVQREYIYLGDIPIALIDYQSGQTTYYLHADHLGTPRAVTDHTGTRRWAWSFQSNPFGEQLPDQDPDNTGSTFTLNLRFPGQYYDAETGLHYNYFRDYEPAAGRYAKPDPAGLIDGPSLYAYARSNALIGSDPLGLFCVRRKQKGPWQEYKRMEWGSWDLVSVAVGLAGGVLCTWHKEYDLILRRRVIEQETCVRCVMRDPDCGRLSPRCWRERRELDRYTERKNIYGGIMVEMTSGMATADRNDPERTGCVSCRYPGGAFHVVSCR